MKLRRDRAALVVVDVQEAFRPAVRDFDRVAHNVAVLVQGARALGVPVIATEQYPRGLGSTVPEVADQLDGVSPIEKTCFSAAGAEEFNRALAGSGVARRNLDLAAAADGDQRRRGDAENGGRAAHGGA